MKGRIVSPVEAQSEGHYLIRIRTESEAANPGQFVSLRPVCAETDPFLRRPFSIFDFRDGVYEIIFQVVGKATSILADYRHDEIDIIAPLGNGFTIAKNKKVLLVGGGAGNAPLYFLSRILRENGCDVTQVYGSRTKSIIYCRDKFCTSCNEVIFTTDDGSEGEKGFVTDAVKRLLSGTRYDMMYVCGPKPMMKGLAALVEEYGIPCEFSLENYFGCGTGICYGCTIETREGNRRVCKDGPVFPFDKLDFGKL
jgi:dihydroorotate dehydrogenase electron transfer subunit